LKLNKSLKQQSIVSKYFVILAKFLASYLMNFYRLGGYFTMSISEFEIKRCQKKLDIFLDAHRPPSHLRDQLDINYHINNQSVELFEIRPQLESVCKKIENSFAKATYVKSLKIWKIYWKKSDFKWHSYEPTPSVKYLEDFLNIVSKNEYGCFYN